MGDVSRSRLPKDLRSGILHFGLGAFHRAHQAVFTEDAIIASDGDWGIEAVAMRNGGMARTMNAQDCNYTLVEQHPDGPQFREIGVVQQAWSLPDEPTEIADRFLDPALAVITVTVTEKGYCADLAARRLNVSDTNIQYDLANPTQPKTLLGILTLGLTKRREADGIGITIISCDNLPDNGDLLRSVVLEFARLRDPKLAGWIEAHCTFPNTMVDRITPATTDATLALVKDACGKNDPMVVETEPFSQWVIEDKFAGPHPDWQAAGVLFVPDVAAYEKMKLRMLNGAHSLIAYAGTTHGLSAVRDVMAMPSWRETVRQHMQAAAETLEPLDGFDFTTYADDLIMRFANPAIEHRCAQIASDGSQKLPQRIFAPALERLDVGQPAETFALATALWLRHLQLTMESGRELNDPMAGALIELFDRADQNAFRLLSGLSELDGLALREIFKIDDWNSAVTEQMNVLR